MACYDLTVGYNCLWSPANISFFAKCIGIHQVGSMACAA